MPTPFTGKHSRQAMLVFWGLLGGMLWWLAAQPFAVVRAWADALMPDGRFDLLTPAVFAWSVWGLRLLGLGALFLALLEARCPAWTARIRAWLAAQGFLTGQAVRALATAAWPKAAERPYALLLGLAMLLALAYRLPYLNRPMGHDEAYTVMAFARPGWWTALTDYHLPNNHIFHSLLVSAVVRWWGMQPWLVRLPAFTASLLTLPAVYLVGREMYTAAVGLGAALALVELDPMREYATNARGYMLVVLFTLLMLWSAYIVRRQRNRAAWALLVLSGWLGLFTVPVMLLPWGMSMCWLGANGFWPAVARLYGSRRAFWTRWALAGLLTAALTLASYLPAIVVTGAQAVFANPFVKPLAQATYGEVLRSRLYRTGLAWTAGLPTGVSLLWAFGVLLAWAGDVRARRLPLWALGGVWLGMVLALRRPDAQPRAWLFALPLMALWGMAGWWGVLRRWRYGVRGLLAVLLLAALVSAGRAPTELPERWRSLGADERAVLFLQTRLTAADMLVVTAPDSASVWYYSALHGLPADALHTERPFDRAFILVNRREGQTAAQVWQARGLGTDACPQNAHLLREFGSLQVFECP